MRKDEFPESIRTDWQRVAVTIVTAIGIVSAVATLIFKIIV